MVAQVLVTAAAEYAVESQRAAARHAAEMREAAQRMNSELGPIGSFGRASTTGKVLAAAGAAGGVYAGYKAWKSVKKDPETGEEKRDWPDTAFYGGLSVISFGTIPLSLRAFHIKAPGVLF